MSAGEMKSLIALMAVFVAVSWSTAAAQSHLWSKSLGGPGDQRGSCVEVHGTDVVVTGWFLESVNLGGGPLTSAGGTDIFIAKYDASGTHLFSRRFGGAGYEIVSKIAVDGAGNLLITGAFEGTTELGGGPLTSAGDADIFVAKYDPGGAHVWSRRFGGDAGDDSGGEILADQAGHVIVMGSFQGTVDLGGGPLVSSGAFDMFFAKYDPSGSHVWSRSVGGTFNEGGGAIATDGSDNLISCGYFTQTVDFGGGPMTSAGEGDVFLVKYDPNGAHVWTQAFGGPFLDQGVDLAVTASDGIVLTGLFKGTVDFGGGTLAADSIFGDVFLARYEADGPHVWSKSFGGESGQHASAVAVDGDDSVLITGYFGGSVDFGGGALNSPFHVDIFLAKFDGNGAHQWSRQFGSPSWGDMGSSVAADDNGDVLITGRYRGTVDFGGGPFTAINEDAYLAKYAGGTAVGIDNTPLPDRTFLGSRPNPFTSSTLIEFFLHREESVKLIIYDAKGRHVKTLLDARMSAGWHSEGWDSRDGQGRQIATGVYFYRLVVGSRVHVKKAVLVK